MNSACLYIYSNDSEILIGIAVAPTVEQAVSMAYSGFNRWAIHFSALLIEGRDNSLLARLDLKE